MRRQLFTGPLFAPGAFQGRHFFVAYHKFKLALANAIMYRILTRKEMPRILERIPACVNSNYFYTPVTVTHGISVTEALGIGTNNVSLYTNFAGCIQRVPFYTNKLCHKHRAWSLYTGR